MQSCVSEKLLPQPTLPHSFIPTAAISSILGLMLIIFYLPHTLREKQTCSNLRAPPRFGARHIHRQEIAAAPDSHRDTIWQASVKAAKFRKNCRKIAPSLSKPALRSVPLSGFQRALTSLKEASGREQVCTQEEECCKGMTEILGITPDKENDFE